MTQCFEMIESHHDDDEGNHREGGNQRVRSQGMMEACYYEDDEYEKGWGFQSRRNPLLCSSSS